MIPPSPWTSNLCATPSPRLSRRTQTSLIHSSCVSIIAMVFGLDAATRARDQSSSSTGTGADHRRLMNFVNDRLCLRSNRIALVGLRPSYQTSGSTGTISMSESAVRTGEPCSQAIIVKECRGSRPESTGVMTAQQTVVSAWSGVTRISISPRRACIHCDLTGCAVPYA